MSNLTQITSCDWLSFSVLLSLSPEEKATEPRLTTPAGFFLQEFTGTNQYKRRAILYEASGEKVLTLLWQPHSRIIDGNSMFVEVANPLLYTGHYLSVPDILQEIHPYTWQSLSRLDIATDFQPTLSQYQTMTALQTGAAYVQGKREGTQWHSYASAAKYVQRTPHLFSWGSKTSAIKWKLYNKTKEIYERATDGRRWCTKPYIAALWEANGLDPKADTWRVEVSIMGSGQQEWRGQRLGWHIVEDPDSLQRLFYDLYAARMKIRLNQGHDNKRYDKEIEFLFIPPDDISRVQKAAPSRDQTRVAFAPTLRALVQHLERPEVAINEQVHSPLLATLRHITLSQGLRGYFAAMVGCDIMEYCETYPQKRDGQQTPAAPIVTTKKMTED